MEITTDNQIQKLISNPKNILKKETTKLENKYKRRNIKLKDSNNNDYQIYVRQNIENENDFSCGLSVILEDKSFLTLVRCNGNHHTHTNKLEKNKLNFCFHIHQATERYIQEGLKKEGFAEKTDAYQNIEDAYEYLLKKCRIQDDVLEGNLFGKNIWN